MHVLYIIYLSDKWYQNCHNLSVRYGWTSRSQLQPVVQALPSWVTKVATTSAKNGQIQQKYKSFYQWFLLLFLALLADRLIRWIILRDKRIAIIIRCTKGINSMGQALTSYVMGFPMLPQQVEPATWRHRLNSNETSPSRCPFSCFLHCYRQILLSCFRHGFLCMLFRST